MPEYIVFKKPSKSEDIDVSTLKSISPCFYWCSAHEFPEFELGHKYLFQHQIYFLEGSEIISGEVSQQWHRSKNQIREDIISFIESWSTHKRILIGPENKESTSANYFNKIYHFTEFAEFVGQTIYKLKKDYIEQASLINFDLLQKEYWKMIAINNNNKNENYSTVLNTRAKKSKSTKKNKSTKDK